MDEMNSPGQRWQGPKSDYPWEQQALDFIKAKLPDAEPYRAWQTFTFTTNHGHVREVDLLIATPGGLFLVEIKSHPGRAANNGSAWVFREDGKTRTIENPLHFTDLKAKELKGQLDWAARELGIRERIPRIEAVVFLSAETLRCEFDETQRQRVYGRDDRRKQTGLPGIWADFLNQPPTSERNRVTPSISKQLSKVLHKAGIGRLHKIGRVGPYELEPKSFDAGPTWEDYLAHNPSMPTDQPRRVRVYLTERTATDDERRSTQRAARREYLALQGISHDGIVRAETYSDELLAGPAVVFLHGRDWQRLDHFMATHESLELETRLEMIRQLAEALDHAHRRHLYHRALAARCVYVELDGRYPRLRIADWQVAARPHGTMTTTSSRAAAGNDSSAPASLIKHVERSAGAYLAPEFSTPDAPPALLDVFGLGALSYLILTGNPPADTREQLAQQLTTEHALVPSSVTDSISPSMDALVREATAIYPGERTESVRRFLKDLDRIEDEITAPDDGTPEPDPLTAGKGDEIAGWTVERVLGKGSTSRALLVAKEGGQRVFKVALNDGAARRLEREAQQLGQLTDSHVVRLLDPPFEAGPADHRRKVIGVEYLAGDTLADELRRHGRMTIHELERLGEDLFQALKFLDGRDVWHRDIKPDNLALRPLERKGRELVLFDFSLAGTPDTELGVGTKDYLDPFLGTGRRDRYDQAAELYAVAVTLHEMASTELPSWGDDIIPAGFLDRSEEAQLAEDVFDPVLRDGLVEFFRTAFNREATARFGSLHEMTRAWTDIFRDVQTVPPLTTASTLLTADADEDAPAESIREDAAAKATPGTTLAAAGLSAYALSIAQQSLGVSTAGELARVPARRITRLRGIGSVPRYELVRRSREWRQRFNLPEAELSHQDKRQDQDRRIERTVAPPQPQMAPSAVARAPEPAPAEPADVSQLSVDDVVRDLIPDAPELAQVVGLAGTPSGARVSPWAGQQEIAQVTGMTLFDVAAHTIRLSARWAKSVKSLTPVREEVVEILRQHGGIMGSRGLAAGMLARRGSLLGDPAERLRVAAICVRAAVDTEERRDKPRLARSRGGADGTVIIALTEDAADDGSPAPRADDLFAYAELLGDQADHLAARDPLPGVTEIKQALRDVMLKLTLGETDNAGHLPWLSDTDLVLLAAAASSKSAATARLELYPRALSPERALKISQAGSFLGGASDAELARRVLARFPDLDSPPRPEDIAQLLTNSYDATRGTDGLLRLRSSTQLSGSRRSRGSLWAANAGPLARDAAREAAEHAHQRLDQARKRGGFVAVKTSITEAPKVIDRLTRMDGVQAVNVTSTFITLLKGIVEEAGRPRWDTVLAADDESATPAAKTGFARLINATWDRLDADIRATAPSGIVLLHDATPLSRYLGGPELLARLAGAARDAGESPHGLWLLCPMQNPKDPPRLDGMTVGVIPGDAEQVVVLDDTRTKGAA
jgi:serine/threonine protein kinase